jgi:AAA+ superfamily predicted ATPase
MSAPLPGWAQEMGDLFRTGAVAQFLIHGNVFDVVPGPDGRLLPLKVFLDEVMFEGYDVVLHYDRGRGIRATKGAEDWEDFRRQALSPELLSPAQTREPGAALELIDRYLLFALNLKALRERAKSAASESDRSSAFSAGFAAGLTAAAGAPPRPGARPPSPPTAPTGAPAATPARASGPRKIAVVIDFAEFVVPRGDPLALGGAFSANTVKTISWANDPAVLQSNIATVLITEGLHDLNELVVENPHAAKLKIPLPDEAEMRAYLEALRASEFPELSAKCEVPLEVLARRLSGLSRVGAHMVLALALKNQKTITSAWLSQMKKAAIERECNDLLEFLESPFTLDHVAGHDAVKAWLREDTQLLKKGMLSALPMGYLIAGRIGTGKTFLVSCWAGELGIPCVVFKNFRDRWVGATESNLEKIFAILRALGQVVVFVDEADQAAGKREGGEGDSGLSGRVYSMLAKEMSDTRNRGRVIWVFATSRPDLLEVDLKRQGRLDVHIPLFPPQTAAEMRALLLSVAKKLKFPLAESDLPDLPEGLTLGGNEIEGILVRALRIHALAPEPHRPLKEVLTQVFGEVRPSAYTRKLEYMDLVAVKECTDTRFLPEGYRKLAPEEIERRIDELRRFV